MVLVACALPQKGLCQTPSEIASLVDLFEATGRSTWSDNRKWNIGTPCGNKWYGVTCINVASVLRVTKLRLSNNNLKGTIPSSISNLNALTTLDLSSTSISGTIPSSIGNLKALTALLLHDCSLTGPIPPAIANVTKLNILTLFDNSFTGTLPAGTCASCQLMYIHKNQIGGSLPSFTNYSQLQNLSIFQNNFKGILELPSESVIQVLIPI